MPLYEYECEQGHKQERFKPMSQSSEEILCSDCGQVAKRIISRTNWYMGFKFLKGKSEKSPAAPTDSGYHPAWDEAYKP